MGALQSLSRDRIEYRTIIDNSNKLEKINDGLRVTIAERDASIKLLQTSLSNKSKLFDSSYSEFTATEKQLRNKLQLLTDHNNSIRQQLDATNSLLVDANNESSNDREEIDQLNASNSLLSQQLETMTSNYQSIKNNFDENNNLIQGLQTKNSDLRQQLRTQQDEITNLKKSISMINNIADNIVDNTNP